LGEEHIVIEVDGRYRHDCDVQYERDTERVSASRAAATRVS
jgi:hypothetical protein